MTFFDLIDRLLHDTLDVSFPGFMPELVLCATIVAMLLVRMPSFGWRINAFWIALPGSLIALHFAAPWNNLAPAGSAARDALLGQPIFDGLLVYDTFTVYFRSVLLIFAVLFLLFTWLSGIPDREDSPDFYSLVLGATIGMCLMASANHLFMVFLGVEMASVPSYALAGMLKGRRISSEAALKYSVYGAGTAGVMLYGISLLAGALGTLHLPTLAAQLATMPTEVFAERQGVLMLGGTMLMVGLAFKLSAVPFHFWCPDVFEGASAEVNAFLSVASKAAALALLVRVAIGFGHVPEPKNEIETAQRRSAAVVQVSAQTLAPGESPGANDDAIQAAPDNMSRVRHFMVGLISLLSALTCTFGNLAAYGQTNIKRLLAYSTIAHAGYMMMPIAAAVELQDSNPALAEQAIAALCFYVGVYLFMNLGAFAIVAFLRNAMRSEEIADYAGLIRRAPGVVLCFSVILISLLGLPPLAGFWPKALAFYALVTAKLYVLLVIGGLNTVISLFYYLRVVKTMTLDPEPADRLPVQFSLVTAEGVYTVVITLPTIALGVGWDALNRWAQAAAHTLLS
ncbi:MAG TPA: NADH-quinone oxidoreductase subunit N [Pirellulales bacterium]|nr:NADH-quinone oxidoreductase subunit N [Pirellulales bacterium]